MTTFTSTAREDVNRAVTLRHGPDRGKPMTWREASQHPSMFDQENSIDAIIRIVDGKIEYIDTVRPEDPEPWVESGEDDLYPWGPWTGSRHSDAPGPDDIALYAPRPGYRPQQNPILAALRQNAIECQPLPEAVDMFLSDADSGERGTLWDEAFPEQIEHARKVLTRLANVYKED